MLMRLERVQTLKLRRAHEEIKSLRAALNASGEHRQLQDHKGAAREERHRQEMQLM